MGPSGFQTKGLEYRGVVGASLFFSLLALCHVRCFTGTLTVCRGRIVLDVFPALWPYTVEYSYWISYSCPDRYF